MVAASAGIAPLLKLTLIPDGDSRGRTAHIACTGDSRRASVQALGALPRTGPGTPKRWLKHGHPLEAFKRPECRREMHSSAQNAGLSCVGGFQPRTQHGVGALKQRVWAVLFAQRISSSPCRIVPGYTHGRPTCQLAHSMIHHVSRWNSRPPSAKTLTGSGDVAAGRHSHSISALFLQRAPGGLAPDPMGKACHTGRATLCGKHATLEGPFRAPHGSS